MKYQGIEVTPDNYLGVFEGFMPDILDLVDICLRQNVDIFPFIDYCRGDPYRLWQVKYFIQDGLPSKFISLVPYGDVLFELRKMDNIGINIDGLLRILKSGQSRDLMLALVRWWCSGYLEEATNFDFITDDCIPVYDFGYSKGINMVIFMNKVYDAYVLRSLVILVKNGKVVGQFMRENWNADVLKYLAELSYEPVYDAIIDFIDCNVDCLRLRALVDAYTVGLPMYTVTAREKDGGNKMSTYEIMERVNGVKSGLSVSEAMNRELSIGMLSAKTKIKQENKTGFKITLGGRK